MSLGYTEIVREDAPTGIYLRNTLTNYFEFVNEDGSDVGGLASHLISHRALWPGDVFCISGQESFEFEYHYDQSKRIYTVEHGNRIDLVSGFDIAAAQGQEVIYLRTKVYDDIPLSDLYVSRSYNSATNSHIELTYTGSEIDHADVYKHVMGKFLKFEGHEAILPESEKAYHSAGVTRINMNDDITGIGFSSALATNTLVSGYATKQEVLEIKNSLFLTGDTSSGGGLTVDSSHALYDRRTILENYIFSKEKFKIEGIDLTVFEVNGDYRSYIVPYEDLTSYSIESGSKLTFGEPPAAPGTITVTAPLIDINNHTALDISGTTENISTGSEVAINITDGTNTVSGVAYTLADGSYSGSFDVNTLADGDITVDVNVVDETGAVVVSSVVTTKSVIVLGENEYIRDSAPRDGTYTVNYFDANSVADLNDFPYVVLDFGTKVTNNVLIPGDIFIVEGQENFELEVVGQVGDSFRDRFHITPSSFYVEGFDKELAVDSTIRYLKTKRYKNLPSSDIMASYHDDRFFNAIYSSGLDFESFVKHVAGKSIKLDGVDGYISYERYLSHGRFGSQEAALIPQDPARYLSFASENEINKILNTLYVTNNYADKVILATSHPTYTVEDIFHNFLIHVDPSFSVAVTDSEGFPYDLYLTVNLRTSNELFTNEDLSVYTIASGTYLNFGDDTLYSASLTASADDIDTTNETAAPIQGTYANLEQGTLVKIKATDSLGSSVFAYTSAKEDGSYSSEVDVSSLNSGTITYETSVTDQKWDTVTATTTAEKTTALNGTMSLNPPDDINANNASNYTVSGSTTNIAAGEIVNITITDSEANEVSRTAAIDNVGIFTASFDVNSLVNGAATVSVSVVDGNGTLLTDDVIVNVAIVPSGSISADDAQEVDYSNEGALVVNGQTSDIAEGSEVTVTVTDELEGSVQDVVQVQPDGSYTSEVDVSGLADGTLTIEVTVVDQRGDTVTTTTTVEKDTRLPGSIDLALPAIIDKSNVSAVEISGGTTNTLEASTVTVELTDGINTVSGTALTQADGSYSMLLDVNELDDDILTVTASVMDQRGDLITASGTVEKDSLLPGSISIKIGSTSNISAVTVSGSTVNTPSGSQVGLQVVDGAEALHSFTAVTDEAGDYQTTLNLSVISDGTFTITASVTDETGAVVADNAQAQKSTSVEQGGTIAVSAGDIGKNNVDSFVVWGSTSNVNAGQSVSIVAQDSGAGSVSTTASVTTTGEYSASLNASELLDGAISVTATTTDEIGGTIADSVSVEKDALHPGNITVSSEAATKENVSEVSVSGVVTNTPSGNVVSITATGEEGEIARSEAEVIANGTYASTIDLNALADGQVNIVITVEDETQATISTSVIINKDSLHPGSIEINSVAIGKNNVANAPVFGNTLNVPAGNEIWIVFEDIDDNQVSVYTVSDIDSYEDTADISDLNDGIITITAITNDETGAEISVNTQIEKDALHPGTIDVFMPDVGPDNDTRIQVSGSTFNVPEFEQVTIRVTDAEGGQVTSTATVGADGSYIKALDLSALVDGDLAISVSVMDETGDIVSATEAAKKDTASTDDFTLSNLQSHYGRNFPTGVNTDQFRIAKSHTLNYVKTFLIAAKLELDDEVYSYIKEAVWDIAHYKLWLNAGTPSESITTKNEDAIKWLKDIAKGNVRIKMDKQESRKKGLHTIQLLR